MCGYILFVFSGSTSSETREYVRTKPPTAHKHRSTSNRRAGVYSRRKIVCADQRLPPGGSCRIATEGERVYNEFHFHLLLRRLLPSRSRVPPSSRRKAFICLCNERREQDGALQRINIVSSKTVGGDQCLRSKLETKLSPGDPQNMFAQNIP